MRDRPRERQAAHTRQAAHVRQAAHTRQVVYARQGGGQGPCRAHCDVATLGGDGWRLQ